MIYLALFALLVCMAILAPLGRLSQMVASTGLACALLVLYVGNFISPSGGAAPLARRLSLGFAAAGGVFFLVVAVGASRFDLKLKEELPLSIQVAGIALVLAFHVAAAGVASALTRSRVGSFGKQYEVDPVREE